MDTYIAALISVIAGSVVGSVICQGYLAIWSTSSFGRFAEFPILLLYSAAIITLTFIFLIIPVFFWLRSTGRRISWRSGFAFGLVVGCVIMAVLTVGAHWQWNAPLLTAGSLSGAVGVAIFAKLSSLPRA